MKLLFLALALVVINGCSSKVINNKEQTFTEFVILNKNSEWKGEGFGDLDSDCFPLIRLMKWNKAD